MQDAVDLASLRYDAQGLVTVVVQDKLTGEVRMLAHANEAALRQTLESRRATFWSRSRQSLWVKGETSGHTIAVSEVWVDCDRDAVLYLCDPHGPSCHTGAPSCFYTRLDRGESGDTATGAPTDAATGAAPMFLELDHVIAARAHASAAKSYTRSLLDGGPARVAAKVREEGEELARALEREGDLEVVKESADVLFHLAVGLRSRGLTLRDVEAELARRFGVSGHDEKAARSRR